MSALSRALDRAGLWLACLSVYAIFFLTIAEIALRPFGISIVFANDLQGFLMVTAVFFALGDITRRREHIIADFFIAMMPERVRSALDLVCHLLIGIAYVLLLMWMIGSLAYGSYVDAVRSEGVLRVPLVFPQSLIVDKGRDAP
jgi:TRAP-type C4-dicarboxylate transport system permease small subunit